MFILGTATANSTKHQRLSRAGALDMAQLSAVRSAVYTTASSLCQCTAHGVSSNPGLQTMTFSLASCSLAHTVVLAAMAVSLLRYAVRAWYQTVCTVQAITEIGRQLAALKTLF